MSMNKTNIEWCDYTWNPVTGCLGPKGDGVRCPYCYAHRLAKGRLRKPYLNGACITGTEDDPFAPRFWPERLEEPLRLKEPSRIFVCSQGDLFGGWVEKLVIASVLNFVQACPQHTFMFLTKWPQNLARWKWPPNAWVGATATQSFLIAQAAEELKRVEAPVKYLSIEPLLGQLDYPNAFVGLDWIIVGAQTGPGAMPPKRLWVEDIIEAADRKGAAVFLKDNLNWPEKRQEFPKVGA